MKIANRDSTRIQHTRGCC